MATTKKKTGLGTRGLGRGLDSLIPEVEEVTAPPAQAESGKPLLMDIHQIEPNRDQPRKVFEEESLAELAESIRRYGVLQPLLVQKKDDYYAIVAGERRWRAALEAGLKEVPVVIGEYAPEESMEIALIENIQRQDLNPVEEAKAYETLINEYGLKQEEVAERVGRSRAAVTNSLRLLKLNPFVLKQLADGKLSAGHARALLGFEDGLKQMEAAQIVIDNGMNVRQTEQLVKDLLNPPEKPERPKKPELPGKSVYQDIEKKLKEQLGTRVAIRRKNEEAGKIEITYSSVDELERILEMLKKAQ